MRAKLFAAATVVAVMLAGMNARTARSQNAASPANPCDRACLRGFVDQYIAAMVKHDLSGLPLTSDYKYTENTATMPLGDGLWVGASEAPTTFKSYAVDPASN